MYMTLVKQQCFIVMDIYITVMVAKSRFTQSIFFFPG